MAICVMLRRDQLVCVRTQATRRRWRARRGWQWEVARREPQSARCRVQSRSGRSLPISAFSLIASAPGPRLDLPSRHSILLAMMYRSTFKSVVRRVANAAGIDIHRIAPKAEGRRIYCAEDYPVNSVPRWGHGKPPHPQIAAILNRQRQEYSALLRQLSVYARILVSVPQESSSQSLAPFWNNGFFEGMDAAALVGMLGQNSIRGDRVWELNKVRTICY
jgi:hypothetical protein